ncbi:MAG TPA: tRNA 2-thiouridine(34) synthase MnmA [Candidatus Coprovivens excrementavium]|nr:tRNA 2-thiouridine(34) synthase MnmA [Candidatus Coprovivens excrementavium]
MYMKRVLIGMSGGVDSSVAAYLLKKEGYEVIGLTMSLFPSNNETSIEDAKIVCSKLNIKHYVFDFSKEFNNKVIKNFIKCYQNAQTPNPCIECNKYLKFGLMWQKAQELNCDYIATGHYASIKDNKLCRIDSPKDQSYFLYKIDKSILPHILFPLNKYINKDEIRKIAEEQNLCVYNKKDSQDICFIPHNDYTSFLEQNLDNLPNKGDFIYHGKVIGQHKGLIYYTIGQRKGLGISYLHPLYVISLNKENNQVILGDEEELYTKIVNITDINILVDKLPSKAQAKIRYKSKLTSCNIEIIDNNNLRIIFDEPVKSVTPGQSLVLYDNDIVLGGGIIKE